jgi:SAM-dependent methyltransferase
MESEAYHLWELSIASSPGDPRRIMPPILESDVNILDVGCGAGQTLIASNLAPGVVAIGVDLDHSALSLGRRWTQSIRFVCAKGENLPFRSGCFDLVYSRVAMPYMHIQWALAEMGHVLRDGGHLWLVLHPFSMTVSALIRDLSRLRIKGAVYYLYVMANGLVLHFTGKQLSLPLGGGRCEAFQTSRGIVWALRCAGFEEIEVDRSDRFVVTARKRTAAPVVSGS